MDKGLYGLLRGWFYIVVEARNSWEGGMREPQKQMGQAAFAGMLEVFQFPDCALKQKCTLSERSEFGHFCFALSKIRKLSDFFIPKPQSGPSAFAALSCPLPSVPFSQTSLSKKTPKSTCISQKSVII